MNFELLVVRSLLSIVYALQRMNQESTLLSATERELSEWEQSWHNKEQE